MVGVEDAENVVCKRGWVAMREECSIYVLELLFGQQSRGTVLDKTWLRLGRVACVFL